jgi:DNA-binding beta-propeller fold protein YncE
MVGATLAVALALALMLLSCFFTPLAHADGGAPNLAYVAGTDKGISVIDVMQQKVTSTIAAPGEPHSILLSNDGRFLYVTEPQMGRVAIIAAKTGDVICTATIAGQPTLLSIDPGSNTLYTAGNGATLVTALDPTNCKIKQTFTASGPVYGLAVAVVGSGLSGSTGNQLWVADSKGLSIFDDLTGQLLTTIAIAGGAHYLTVPPGATVYFTTDQGSVAAVDLNSHRVTALFTGGSYGPMDYNQVTGEVYVPDHKNNQLVVLAAFDAHFALPKQPSRVYKFGVSPASVAITSDGQLGFIALSGGDVAMLDVPARQIVNTIHVGGSPQFIITGVYPPVLGTTPQQAGLYTTLINIAAYVMVIALLIVPILLFSRYAKAQQTKESDEKSEYTNDRSGHN